jgi:hypothetical protein
LLAVNDFFTGQRTHVSARYIIKHGGLKEPQSSSGVIVSTSLGFSGWMKSVLAGASRISSSVIGHPCGGQQENDRFAVEDVPAFLRRAPLPSEDSGDEVSCGGGGSQGWRAACCRNARNGVAAHGNLGKTRQKKQSYGFSELSNVIGKWKSEELIFAVREPFPSKTTGTTLVFGKVSAGEPLCIESLMGENGVIFSDGMGSDFLAFNSGTEAVITLADRRGHIVV